MGAIIKFVLILIIVLYLINKVGKFFYELFFPEKAAQQKQRANSSSNQRTTSQQQNHREGDIHIPREQSSKDKKFKGGDYVDFEEVD